MTANTTNENIPVIDLSVTRKQKFRVAGIGNDDGILELNTSDLATITRLSETYPKLKELDNRVSSLQTEGADEDDDKFLSLGAELGAIDTEMRNCVDYIFDSNVSEVCAPSGSMYDPFGGKLRWEHIVEVLATLYESNLSKELNKLRARSKTHTAKYTGKK